ncbi:MAG TPA: LPS export ABC transporter periplasmic protein LptC [Limnochorda sp.]
MRGRAVPRVSPGAARRGWLLLGVGLAFGAVLVLWLWGTGGPRPAEPAEPAREPVPPRLEGVTVDGFFDGARQWTLEVGALAEEGERVDLEQVRRGLFYREGNPWLTLQAARGRWMPSTNGLELEGQVAIELLSGGRLETERVAWHGAAGRLEATSQVVATLDGNRLTAGSMRAEAATGIVHLAGGVELERPDGQRLRADGARWIDGERRLELVGRIDWFLPALPER